VGGGNPLGQLPIMSIENPTLVHFRHFSSLLTNENRASRAQKNLFMQNKPNFCRFWAKNSYLEEKQSQFKPNSNPIQTQFKPNSKPIKANQSQNKPNQTQF